VTIQKIQHYVNQFTNYDGVVSGTSFAICSAIQFFSSSNLLATLPARRAPNAELRMADFSLRTAFEAVAVVGRAQEKILAFIPQDFSSEVNADLIKKYELTGLATLVQQAKGPDPS